MAGISEEYITEAALVPALGASPAEKPESRFAALSRALNSGWGVACICFIVAIAAVVGMVAWGRMGGPAGPGSDPTVRFAFSYEMTGNDGSAWSGMAYPGDVVTVDTSIVNHGKSFTGYDFFAHAQFVHQEDEAVILEGHYPVADAAPLTVENGQKGSRAFHFHIPENATPGVYDLVLSYDGEKQVFSGALTVGDPTGETKPPINTTDRYAFSFGYEPFGGFAIPGDRITISAWVRNDGASFIFTGSSMGFAPSAVLVHMDTGYRIEGTFDVTTDHTEVTVNTGDVGCATQEFFIPADAPTGDYDLILTYDTATKTFEKVLTVAIPTVIGPAVLYNLTMPIGSDWLYEPIEEVYADGEKVTVRIQFATDVGTLFFLNGEVIAPAAEDDQMGYWEYSFIMPAKDSEIIFQTFDGMAPYSDILQAYYTANPKAKDVLVIDYGTYGDGVRVSIIYDDRFAYAEAEAEHRIGPAVIRYSDGNIMQALYNGTFCSLSKAYETGLLSDADLAAIENLHREWNPHLYADDE